MNTSDRLFDLVWRQTLLAMVMMILSNIGAILMDGIITTRVFGATASAAIGLITPYAMLVSLFGGLIGTGCQTLCSNALGNGRPEEAGRALATSVFFGGAVSAVLTAIMYAFARPICQFIGASGENAELLAETTAYLRGVSLGTIGMVLNIVLTPVVQLYAGRKQVNRSVLVIFVSDAVFDLAAVVLKAGCWGIGLATSLSTCLGTLVMLAFALSGRTGIHLSPRYFAPGAIGEILRQGMPEAVKRFVRMGQDVLVNYLVLLTASGAAMAGKTVGSLLASLLSALGLGASSAMYLLSGVYLATEDEKRLLALGRKQVKYLLITLALAAISFLLAPQITSLMLVADAQTRVAAVISVRCILVQMPVYIAFEMVTCYLQSIGQRKRANLLSLLGSVVFALPLIALMGSLWGAPGVLLSTPAALLFALAVLYIALCVKNHRLAGLRDILHLSECIQGESMELIAHSTVKDLRETVACSESIRRTLTEKGSDVRSAFAVSLFVEEVCTNILIHGSSAHQRFRREKIASVYASVKDGIIMLRISDNCGLFDPVEKLKSMRERVDSPECGIGLRLIFSMADEASYSNMLNMNHLFIRVPMHTADCETEDSGNQPRFIPSTHPG